MQIIENIFYAFIVCILLGTSIYLFDFSPKSDLSLLNSSKIRIILIIFGTTLFLYLISTFLFSS